MARKPIEMKKIREVLRLRLDRKAVRRQSQCGRLSSLFQQFVLEPLDCFRQSGKKGFFVVAAAGDDFESVINSRSGQGLIHGLGLLERDDFVTFAVNDQSRRVLRADIRDWRFLPI